MWAHLDVDEAQEWMRDIKVGLADVMSVCVMIVAMDEFLQRLPQEITKKQQQTNSAHAMEKMRLSLT